MTLKIEFRPNLDAHRGRQLVLADKNPLHDTETFKALVDVDEITQEGFVNGVPVYYTIQTFDGLSDDVGISLPELVEDALTSGYSVVIK